MTVTTRQICERCAGTGQYPIANPDINKWCRRCDGTGVKHRRNDERSSDR